MYRHIWRCKPLRESGGAAESRRCTNVSPSQVEAEESRSWNESAGVRDEAESRPVTRTVCVRADKYRACRVPRVFSSLCFFSASLAAKKNRPIRFRVRTIQCVQRARVSACSVDRVVKLAALGLSPGRRQDHSNDCTVSIYSWNKFYVEMNSDIFWIGISRIRFYLRGRRCRCMYLNHEYAEASNVWNLLPAAATVVSFVRPFVRDIDIMFAFCLFFYSITLSAVFRRSSRRRVRSFHSNFPDA